MSFRIRLAFATALMTLPLAPAAFAQMPPQAEGTQAQREAMAALDFMNGEWRGEALRRVALAPDIGLDHEGVADHGGA